MTNSYDLDLDEDDISEGEREALQWEDHLLPPLEATSDFYPRMTNVSSAFMWKASLRALKPAQPEYLTIPIDHGGDDDKLVVAIARWNLAWEAAQFRRRLFDETDLPPAMLAIAELGDVNVSIVAKTRSRYFEFEPLLQMLPRASAERAGLPLLRAGIWPHVAGLGNYDRFLPNDYEHRLARAWASEVWGDLDSGSRMTAFSKDDPIKLLAHNLDFWVPAATIVMQEMLGAFPEVDNGLDPSPARLDDGSLLEGARIGNPRKGGDIWRGEAEASQARQAMVRAADGTGRLRGILDAVRSNRLEDDFSDRWSFAKEDFERKLHHKRAKVKVTIVELPETIAVQGPESEIVGDMVTNDFLALLDVKERQIVVLLNSGVTKLTEIAETLGYANHSPVSKKLTRIRLLAEQHLRNI